jgi:hypothetical protein
MNFSYFKGGVYKLRFYTASAQHLSYRRRGNATGCQSLPYAFTIVIDRVRQREVHEHCMNLRLTQALRPIMTSQNCYRDLRVRYRPFISLDGSISLML